MVSFERCVNKGTTGVEADQKVSKLMILDKYMAAKGREPAGWFVIYKVGEDLEERRHWQQRRGKPSERRPKRG